MAKTRTQFVCQECGRTSIRPLGRCPSCGAWDTMVEEIISETISSSKNKIGGALLSKALRLDEISGDAQERWPLSMQEFARVLGGGMVPGSIVLLGGDPGIGKSTLMLQVAADIAADSPGYRKF